MSFDEFYYFFDELVFCVWLIDLGGVLQLEQWLFVYENYMIVMFEKFYDIKVMFEVFDMRCVEYFYVCKIFLCYGEMGKVVQYGIMQFNFKYCSNEVCDEIFEQGILLG